MKSFTIMRTGFATIRAENEEIALELAGNLPYDDFEWRDDEIDDDEVQE